MARRLAVVAYDEHGTFVHLHLYDHTNGQLVHTHVFDNTDQTRVVLKHDNLHVYSLDHVTDETWQYWQHMRPDDEEFHEDMLCIVEMGTELV